MSIEERARHYAELAAQAIVASRRRDPDAVELERRAQEAYRELEKVRAG